MFKFIALFRTNVGYFMPLIFTA